MLIQIGLDKQILNAVRAYQKRQVSSVKRHCHQYSQSHIPALSVFFPPGQRPTSPCAPSLKAAPERATVSSRHWPNVSGKFGKGIPFVFHHLNTDEHQADGEKKKSCFCLMKLYAPDCLKTDTPSGSMLCNLVCLFQHSETLTFWYASQKRIKFLRRKRSR